MNILYDHQIFSLQKYGGISRYFYELLNKLDATEEITTQLPLIVSNNHYISNKKFTNHINFVPSIQFRGKQRIFDFLNKLKSIKHLKKQNFNVFHPTYYDPYFLSYIKEKPFVLTVHDMIHEKFSNMFPENDPTSSNKRLLVEKANKIIAISESTKRDLVELFEADPSKIQVVYHGNSMYPSNNVVSKIDIPKQYILFIGGRDGYKNFNMFIQSVQKLLLTNTKLCIICAGGGKFNVDELKNFNELNIISQIFQYDLDDDVLSYLYQNAELFVFPSLYEGFGIPILEAFACECPLVCSNTSSFPEVAGDGACYFDPYNKESVQNAILKVMNDTDTKDILIKNGKKRLEYFSWEKTILETENIYKSLL